MTDITPESLAVARHRRQLAGECNLLSQSRRFLLRRKSQAARFFTAADAEMLAVVERGIRFRQFRLYLLGGPPLHRKGGFDPNEPRLPGGQTGGGEWTREGNGPLRITIYPLPQITDDGGEGGVDDATFIEGLGDPPDIPDDAPSTAQLRNLVIKQTARWLLKAAFREAAAGPIIGTFLNVLDAVEWIRYAYPYIQSYIEPPKTLPELRRAVSTPKRGYDIHHIVEKTSAAQAGFPRRMIDGPDNLVRIPTLKHHEITAWYMRRNAQFGDLSPRDYLRNKSWAERVRVGQQALVIHGVLKP